MRCSCDKRGLRRDEIINLASRRFAPCFARNEPDVIADIADGDRASEIDLEKRELSTTKTVGVLWAPTDDKFCFRHSLQLDGFEFTKRNVFRRKASVYDPLGFLSPYVIRSLLLIQKAWLEARDWEGLLPTHHQREWKKWFRELKAISFFHFFHFLRIYMPELDSNIFRKPVEWSSLHDEMLCREIMVVDPFTGTKKSAVARGKKREEVAENLKTKLKLFTSQLTKGQFEIATTFSLEN